MQKIFLLLGALLIFGGGAAVIARKPINLRNNNPGNLRPSGSFKWDGEIGEEGGFVKFSSMEYGVRAAYINLRSYFNNGFNTIEKIINRWAPAADGNKHNDSYIKFVSVNAGVLPNETLQFNDKVARDLLSAMFKFEGGAPDQSTIDAGIALA